jgi:hypothetical protein
MPAFVEFLLVAVALFLWESTLWLPLRSMALRKRWIGGKWKVLDPAALIATRELGLIPMLPIPPDLGLAPCQVPPLMVDANGRMMVENVPGRVFYINSLSWNDLREEPHHLAIAGSRIRVSSPRCVGVLKRARQRGATLDAAIRLAWRLAMSPGRSGREWRRWKLVSGPLQWNGIILTIGFFVVLPAVFVFRGNLPALLFAGWLWGVMVWTGVHLWWLGKRVYPDARSALRMDALLAMLVPFHAMRAMEIAAVHAMGNTHPAGLLIGSGSLENRWLAHWIRRVLFPIPDSESDHGFSSAMRPLLEKALSGSGKSPEDYDVEPDRSDDPDAARYCPRCHGMFLLQVERCPDCRSLELRSFAASGA